MILLLAATAISAGLWLYERETALPYEAIAVFAVVLLNAAMGYIQEARAESALAALKQMAAAHAKVIHETSAAVCPPRKLFRVTSSRSKKGTQFSQMRE